MIHIDKNDKIIYVEAAVNAEYLVKELMKVGGYEWADWEIVPVEPVVSRKLETSDDDVIYVSEYLNNAQYNFN